MDFVTIHSRSPGLRMIRNSDSGAFITPLRYFLQLLHQQNLPWEQNPRRTSGSNPMNTRIASLTGAAFYPSVWLPINWGATNFSTCCTRRIFEKPLEFSLAHTTHTLPPNTSCVWLPVENQLAFRVYPQKRAFEVGSLPEIGQKKVNKLLGFTAKMVQTQNWAARFPIRWKLNF